MSRATRTAICSRVSRCIVVLQSSGRLPETCGSRGGARHLHEAMHEDAWRHDALGIQVAERNDLVHRGDGQPGGRGHDRSEVARCLAVHEVAPSVALVSLDEGDVGVDRRLEHVHAPSNLARLLAFAQVGAVTRWREKAADASTRRAVALGEVALRYQFELVRAGAVQAIEDLRIDLAWEAADDLAHAPGLEQCGEADFAVAGIVVDDGEVAGALRDEGVDQLGRLARAPEAADHYRRAVRHVAPRGLHAGRDLVDHGTCSCGRMSVPAVLTYGADLEFIGAFLERRGQS